MVNATTTTEATDTASDRRERARAAAAEPASLGLANPNPFGDLHTIQHLTARLARAVKPVMEPLIGGEARTWAEPVAVQRLTDYRGERGEGLSAWASLPAGHEAAPQLILEAGFVLELVDRFFGGPGNAPAALPKDLSASATAMVGRIGNAFAPLMTQAWEPVTPLAFHTGAIEGNPAILAGLEPEDAVVVTRIGIARGEAKPHFIDLLYPVAALKPHVESITRKVHRRTPEVAPAWRQSLTRAVMNVSLPVRTVLAEPVLPLSQLLVLKVGDVIPIGLGDQVPVMVGNDRLGLGTVGTAGGKAAILLNSLALLEGPAQ